MLDREGVKAIFDNEKIDAVIHFAGLKMCIRDRHKAPAHCPGFSIVYFFLCAAALFANDPYGGY